MTGKRLRSCRQRALAIILLLMACTLAWLFLALILARSIQPSAHLPM